MDCHAFEFMQRALQDLKKTAFNLDARVSQVVIIAYFIYYFISLQHVIHSAVLIISGFASTVLF